MNPNKPGVKTSEFYAFLGGLATILIGFAQTRCTFNTSDAMAVAGLVASYVIGRSWVKASAATKNPPVTQTVNVKNP